MIHESGSLKIYLVTHEREVDRTTNTGAITLSVAGGAEGVVQRIIWSRISPDPKLLQLLEQGAVGLLYPLPEAGGREVAISDCDNFILLDATWQEARKIYNRSAYLKSAGRVSLAPSATSRFRLRRNQREGGLCTAECVIEILRAKGRNRLAAEIESAFDRFNSAI